MIAIFLGRSYLPGRTAVSGEPGAAVETPAPTPTPPPPTAADDSPIPGGRGRIVIVTQPPGIKVLLDRKAVGETPLRIDVTPGRRMLTFLTSGGEVIRSVRVAAGKTETLDIPVFSGWVAVFAPIVLQVAADGKSIGTTEQNRLMLPPGKHQLTVTNRELGYTATQEVEIEPGEVKTVNIQPRGTVNLNAIPWAEVWLTDRNSAIRHSLARQFRSACGSSSSRIRSSANGKLARPSRPARTFPSSSTSRSEPQERHRVAKSVIDPFVRAGARCADGPSL